MSTTYASAGFGIDWLDSAGPTFVWVVVLGFVFVECALIIGLFLPGDSLLFAAGVVLAQHGAPLHAWLLSAAAVATAIVGNQVGYRIGARTGTRFVARRGGRVLNSENLDRAKDFLDRKGFLAILAARWLPWIRTLAPLVAGAAKMDPRRFLLATSLGGLLWVPILVLSGYYGSGLLDSVPWLKASLMWLAVVGFVLATVYGVWRYRQDIRRPMDAPEAPARHA